MKGDFSRWTFDRKHHYNAVLKQQGRVELDADANEQAAIQGYRDRTTTRDVVGPCGVPRVLGSPDPGGFRVALKRPSLQDVRFAGTKLGLAVGDDGLILLTRDGGSTWQQQEVPGALPTLRGVGHDGKAGILVVGDRGTTLVWEAEHEQWRVLATGGEQDLYWVGIAPRVGAWTVGEGGLILFYDGKKLHQQKSRTSACLRGAWFGEDGSPGWVVGDNGTLLLSEDRGGAWKPVKSGTKADLHAVCLIKTGNHGWAVGGRGTILSVNKGDAGWTVEDESVENTPGLRAVHFPSRMTGWAVGEDGVILNWRGGRWTRQDSPTEEDLNGVWFADNKTGWAVGNNGTAVLTLDAGETWRLVESVPPEMVVGAGRIYVDGILCEVEKPVTYASQPDYWPGGLEPPSAAGRPRTDLVYLDVWDRHITALEDPGLREPALGGPDTATRLKTVWQVKIHRGPTPAHKDELVGILGRIRADLMRLSENIGSVTAAREVLESIEESGREAARTMEQRGTVDPELSRAFSNPAETLMPGGKKVSAAEVARVAVLLERYKEQVAGPEPEVTCCFKPPECEPATGDLRARTRPSEGDKPCLMRPDAGYSLLENQLYRVEVHQPGRLGQATFKWSRDNGSVAASITKIDGQSVYVRHTGKDRVLGFAEGQWVEVVDDRMELHDQAGTLAKVARVDHDARKVEIDPATPVPAVDWKRHPLLRRWDSPGELRVEVPATNEGWIPLEGGIEVKFGDGTYKAGDFWLIPARTATGDIQWPRDAAGNPDSRPPLGIKHHFCPLALLEWKQGGRVVARDCRRFFYPLAPPALHVVGINWKNDAAHEPAQLVEGLRIKLDGEPRPETVSDSSVVVTLEMPFPGNPLFSYDLTVDGEVGPDPDQPNVIVWKPASKAQSGTKARKNVEVSAALLTRSLAAPGGGLRVRVLLRGRLIWREGSGLRQYLDGQVFGIPAKRPDGSYRTGLLWPSGRGEQASDFESWFWLGSQAAEGLRVKAASIFRTSEGELDRMEAEYKPQLNWTEGHAPDCVDVEFTAGPDMETVNAETFRVTDRNGRNVAGQRSLLTATPPVVRFKAEKTLPATCAVAVTAGIKDATGTALDGEPTQLPSGDGTPGGDFTFDVVMTAG
jgi:photosystem II stability/assembly factor-like uncharacterized protein